MTETPDKRQIYYIPENYISESRIHLGQSSLRVRYLVDSAGMSLVLGLFAVLIISLTMKNTGIQAKITVGLIICGPGFLIGQIGFNGDPISTAFRDYSVWRKTNQIRIYNSTPRLLGTDPVKALHEDGSGKDAIVEAINKVQLARKRKYEAEKLLANESFDFEFDPGIDRFLEDNGDYPAYQSAEMNVDIKTGYDLKNISYLYSSDGYNDDDPDEEAFNLSDYETD